MATSIPRSPTPPSADEVRSWRPYEFAARLGLGWRQTRAIVDELVRAGVLASRGVGRTRRYFGRPNQVDAFLMNQWKAGAK